MTDAPIKFYIFGRVQHQDDTNPIEMLGDATTEEKASNLISRIKNRSFPPENIFVIKGQRLDVSIKSVSFD